MIKRLFSKRSGFTLVEIIVAFAVFAIMAAMIMQILNMVTLQRKSNVDFSDDIGNQEQYLVTHEKNLYDEEKGDNGTLVLDFGDGALLSAGYQMNGVTPNESNSMVSNENVNGLAYFVSKNLEASDETSSGVDSGDGDDEEEDKTGAQTERVDARITGTRGFEYISVNEVKGFEGKQSTVVKQYVCDFCGYSTQNQWEWHNCEGSGWKQVTLREETKTIEGTETYYIYVFDLCAKASDSMNPADIPYANYRLYFCDASGNPCEIAYANYLNYSGDLESGRNNPDAKMEITTSVLTSSPHQENKYVVSLTGPNGIRVATPFTSGGIKFTENNHTRIEIAFKTDPGLTTASFGDNGTKQTGDSYLYKANTTVGGVNIGPNIYGAKPKK